MDNKLIRAKRVTVEADDDDDDQVEEPQRVEADPFASAKLLQEIWEHTSPGLKSELATRLVAKFYERVNKSELVDPFIDAKLRELLRDVATPEDINDQLKDKLRSALRGNVDQQVESVVRLLVGSIADTLKQRMVGALGVYR